jgi:hypothetical protein
MVIIERLGLVLGWTCNILAGLILLSIPASMAAYGTFVPIAIAEIAGFALIVFLLGRALRFILSGY